MKSGFVIIMILVLVLTGVFASVAWAGSSTTQIIKDASDGTINGHYSAAAVRAALAAVENNPVYQQYSDIAGVLQAYLASLSASGSGSGGATQTGGSPSATTPATLQAGQLDYTGGRLLVVFALGGALLVAGAALRWRWA